MNTEDPILKKKSAAAFVLPLLIPALTLLALLSWAVESFLAPGISVAGYAGAIGAAGLIVGATLFLLYRTGLSDG